MATATTNTVLRPPLSKPSDPIEYTTIALRVRVPNEALKSYEADAQRQGRQLEEVVAQRVVTCAAYDSVKPLYFTDEQRMVLEKIMCRNYSDPVQVLQDLSRFYSVKVESVSIGLDPRLIQRLRTRCHASKDFIEFFRETISRLLREYTGA